MNTASTAVQAREPDILLSRLRRWWLLRLPRTDDHLLTQRTLYILPTRAGWMLGLTLLLLLVGSINYQLNLGYLLTFALTGCASISVLVTHQNLRGLRLQWQACPDSFAGQPLQLPVLLRNDSRRDRHGMALHCLARPTLNLGNMAPIWADVSAHDSTQVLVPGPLLKRGRWSVPALQIESRFPLGIFRTWSWWRPAATLLIYPAPEPDAPALPLRAPDQGAEPHAARLPPDTHAPDGVRAYRPGDPMKWLLWKKVAQHPGTPEQWVSRDFAAPPVGATAELWLDAAHCGQTDAEAQLSRLCAWVLQAEQAGQPYGLRLADTQVPPGLGHTHRQRCLEALACA